MIIGVASDIHLDCISTNKEDGPKRNKIIRIGKELTKDLNHLIVAGDVSTYNHLEWHMEALYKGATCPIHWVMGNHDYWGGSFNEAEQQAENIKGYIHNKVFELTKDVALIGINSWFDGRLGNINDLWNTNDHTMISNLAFVLHKGQRDSVLAVRNKADKQAELAKIILNDNVKKYKKIILVTHYPPWHNEEDRSMYYPWSVNSKMGQVILDIAANNPNTVIEVIAGHVHYQNKQFISDNVIMFTEKAVYGQPVTRRRFVL